MFGNLRMQLFLPNHQVIPLTLNNTETGAEFFLNDSYLHRS
jgi:hypothetical protein